MRITPEFAADPKRLIVIAAFVGALVLVAAPPIEWLPSIGVEATSVLGALLAAQAAIAVLSLAVVLFRLSA